MTDPERLLKRPQSATSALLLRAGVDERPSSAALQRTLNAVAGSAAAAAVGTISSCSAAASSAGTTVASASVAGTGVAVIVKWVGLGAIGGAIVATGAHQVIARQNTSAPSATTSFAPKSSAPELETTAARDPRRTSVAPPPSGSSAETQSSSAALELTIEAPGADRGRDERPPAVRAGTDAAPTTPTVPLLAAEVAFVDAGRAALQRGADAEALARLADYERTFPKGQLGTEVSFLRMEAHSRSGNDAAARALARRIITRGVAGPQAARARAVLAR